MAEDTVAMPNACQKQAARAAAHCTLVPARLAASQPACLPRRLPASCCNIRGKRHKSFICVRTNFDEMLLLLLLLPPPTNAASVPAVCENYVLGPLNKRVAPLSTQEEEQRAEE